MLKTLIAAAALLAAVPAAPALADGPSVTVELGIYGVDDRNGYRDHDRGRDWDDGVSRRQALRIASDYGMARVYDIDRHGNVWEISGSTYRGGRMELEISARSGRVLDVDYGRERRGWDNGRGRGW